VRRSRKAGARVRVPSSQRPFFFVPGEAGGWFVSLLWAWGDELAVDLAELHALLDGSRGQVVVGRRLVGSELRLLESYVDDVGAEVHSRIVPREEQRWRSPRRR
jgi:hypothetical protein